MSLVWRALKNREKARLRCTKCDQIAVQVRSEPVQRKVHKRKASKRRLVAICVGCKTLKVLTYGGAFGRKSEAGRQGGRVWGA